MDFTFLSGVLLIVAVLTAWHEAGHLFCARLLGLEVEKVGFALRPFPHPFVSVANVPDSRSKYLFLAAGTAATLLIGALLWVSGALSLPMVYLALCIQLIIETNPFYSDITIAVNTSGSREEKSAYLAEHMPEYVEQYGLDSLLSYQSHTLNAEIHRYFNRYSFTPAWYLHFISWSAFILFLLSPF